jgi:hypothetical protein
MAFSPAWQTFLAIAFLLLNSKRISLPPPGFFAECNLQRSKALSCFNFLPSRFAKKFELDDSFVTDLYEATRVAPRNRRTGRREVMFTIFDLRQLTLARNCLCSSRSVGLPANYHLFIALDEVAFAGLYPMNSGTLLLNLSGRRFGYPQFTRMKPLLHLVFMMWDIEATSCDDDIVFLRDPRELFREESNMEGTIEDRQLEFGKNFPWWVVNVGFVRVLPSSTSIAVYKTWIFHAINTKDLDQDSLHRILQRGLLFARNETACFNVKGRFLVDGLFCLRYYDPLLVQNGWLMRERKHSAELARIRKIREPYVCHLSWIEPAAKINFLKNSGLWFLSDDNLTCGVLPDKRLYAAWRSP